MATCPNLREPTDEPGKRGKRDSPRTPAQDEKLAKLRSISHKMSPNAQLPVLPGEASASMTPASSVQAGTAVAQGTPVTMEAMSALLAAQLGPLTGSVNRLEEELNQFKSKVDVDIKEVKQSSNRLQEDLSQVKLRIDNVEKRGPDESLANRVKLIEKELSDLKVTPLQGSRDQLTAVVGGLRSASSADAAKSWLREAMRKANIDFIDVYDKCKDREFNGMLFVKFGSAEKRDAAIKTFNETKNAFADDRSFMNRDKPIQQRTKFTFLLNFKRMLTSVEWKFQNVSFDEDESEISVAGVPVLRVAVDGVAFKLVWIDRTWEQWDDLTNDPKFKDLVKAAEDKLAKASQSKGKGKAVSA